MRHARPGEVAIASHARAIGVWPWRARKRVRRLIVQCLDCETHFWRDYRDKHTQGK